MIELSSALSQTANIPTELRHYEKGVAWHQVQLVKTPPPPIEGRTIAERTTRLVHDDRDRLYQYQWDGSVASLAPFFAARQQEEPVGSVCMLGPVVRDQRIYYRFIKY